MTTSPEDMRAEAVDKAVDEACCCLICYEEGPDENGGPVRNGVCACRGDSGYFHQACLVNAAKTKTAGEECLEDTWLKCPTCEQFWTGSTLTAMGNECAKFASEKHPENTYLKLAALMTKQSAIMRSSASLLEDMELVSKELFSALTEFFGVVQSASRLQLIHRATLGATYSLGYVAFQRKEPELAIEYFTCSLDSLRARGYGDDDIQVMGIQRMIARAERLLPDADIAASNKKILQLLRASFEKMTEEDGENSFSALESGYSLAEELYFENRFIEAKELFERLHQKALLVLGSHHYLTHNIQYLMGEISHGDI